MTGRLHSHVHVRDANGVPHVYGPGDTVPDWAARRITNPHAWAEPPHFDDEPAAPKTGDTVGRPAQSASKETWAAYAEAAGVPLPPDATKAQIIEAVRAAETKDPADQP